MKKERKPARHFDDQFRLSVLKEYYESGVSCYQIAHKYGVTISNINAWEQKYMNNDQRQISETAKRQGIRI